MKPVEIEALQYRIGLRGDNVDRFWGPSSITTCQRYLRRLMPSPSPWPKTDQASLTRFYGAPGDESQLVNLPAPVPMFYGGTRVKTLRVHRKCADSLGRILVAAHKLRPEIVEALADYSGCYNNRPMRGGSLPSLHARGAAIDLDADDNGNRVSWPVRADMPIEIMECFAAEGWIAAGAFWGRDAMHFQATQ